MILMETKQYRASMGEQERSQGMKSMNTDSQETAARKELGLVHARTQ